MLFGNSYGEDIIVSGLIHIFRIKFEINFRWPDMKISKIALKSDCNVFIFALSSLSSLLLIRGFDSANSLSFGEGYDVEYHHHAGIVLYHLYRWKGKNIWYHFRLGFEWNVTNLSFHQVFVMNAIAILCNQRLE